MVQVTSSPRGQPVRWVSGNRGSKETGDAESEGRSHAVGGEEKGSAGARRGRKLPVFQIFECRRRVACRSTKIQAVLGQWRRLQDEENTRNGLCGERGGLCSAEPDSNKRALFGNDRRLKLTSRTLMQPFQFDINAAHLKQPQTMLLFGIRILAQLAFLARPLQSREHGTSPLPLGVHARSGFQPLGKV